MYRKNENCYQIMIAILKMAGVAGFEPTNDGVRGTPKLPNIAQKPLKTHQKHWILTIFPTIYPTQKLSFKPFE